MACDPTVNPYRAELVNEGNWIEDTLNPATIDAVNTVQTSMAAVEAAKLFSGSVMATASLLSILVLVLALLL